MKNDYIIVIIKNVIKVYGSISILSSQLLQDTSGTGLCVCLSTNTCCMIFGMIGGLGLGLGFRVTHHTVLGLQLKRGGSSHCLGENIDEHRTYRSGPTIPCSKGIFTYFKIMYTVNK